MKLKTTLLGKTYTFRDLKEVLAKANEEKTGDKLAGLAAESAQERVAAKVVLSAVTLGDLRENPAVPYEEDEVTRIIQDDVNEAVFRKIRGWTVAEFREWLLDEGTTGDDIRKTSRGLTSEMVAAVCKLMGNLDLIYAANKIHITAHCNTTIGNPFLPFAAQSHHRRPGGHHGFHIGGPELRRGRRGHRPESGDGQPGAGGQGAAPLSGNQGALADSHPDLRPGPRHRPDEGCPGRGALRPDLPVHCGQPEGKRGLRLQCSYAGRSPAAASEGGNRRRPQRYVF